MLCSPRARCALNSEDGDVLDAVFCDAFEMENGKIKKLTAYLMEVKEPR